MTVPASRFPRLSSTDLMFLRLEAPEWPCHYGGLAVVEGESLLDGEGELRLEEVRERLARRLPRVPKLRQRLHDPGWLGGRPLWVDDGQFDIRNHVRTLGVAPPGDEAALLEAATFVYQRPLERGQPLWELWFLTGLEDRRVGVLLKLHHAMADGLGAVAVMGSLFDLAPDAEDPAPASWTPRPVPGRFQLIRDEMARKIAGLRRSLSALRSPGRIPAGLRSLRGAARGFFGGRAAPGSELNQPVGAGRHIRYLRLDLAAMKEVAHSNGGKVNDAVLALWSGGLRHLLISRHRSVSDLELIVGMATTLRDVTEGVDVENRVGTMVFPLPIFEADVHRRLETVIGTTRGAKAQQRPAFTMGLLAALAATPIGKWFSAHQRASNVLVTNVIGPPVPVYMLGARVELVLPIIELVGNIGLTLCAFSYSGEVFLVITADARAFPDVDLVVEGMELDWHALTGAGRLSGTGPAPTTAEGQ